MRKYNKSIRKEAIEIEERVNVNLKDFVKKASNRTFRSEFKEEDLPALYRLLNNPRILYQLGFKNICSGTINLFENNVLQNPKFPYVNGLEYSSCEIEEVIELLPKTELVTFEGDVDLNHLYFTNNVFYKNPSLMLDAIASINDIEDFFASFLPAKYVELKKQLKAYLAKGMTAEFFVAWQKSYTVKYNNKECLYDEECYEEYINDKEFKETMFLLDFLVEDCMCDTKMIEQLLEAERNGEIELYVNRIEAFAEQDYLYKNGFNDISIADIFIKNGEDFSALNVVYTGFKRLKVRSKKHSIDMFLPPLDLSKSITFNTSMLLLKMQSITKQMGAEYEVDEVRIRSGNFRKYVERRKEMLY